MMPPSFVDIVVELFHTKGNLSQLGQFTKRSIVVPLRRAHFVEMFLSHSRSSFGLHLLPSVLKHGLSGGQLQVPCETFDKELHLQIELRERTYLYRNPYEAQRRIVDVNHVLVQRRDNPVFHERPTAGPVQKGKRIVVASAKENSIHVCQGRSIAEANLVSSNNFLDALLLLHIFWKD